MTKRDSSTTMPRGQWIPVLTVASALAISGCGGNDGDRGPTDPPSSQEPTTGSIRVAVTSTGTDVDANGYEVQVDGNAKAAIGSNGTVTLSDLDPGTYAVALEGLAENCSHSTASPMAVTVTAGAPADANFEVSCVAAVGSIEVTVTTTGESLDSDGYTVSVLGGPSGAVDINGTTTLAGVPAGKRTIELTDIAANCDVSPPHPKSVSVAFDETAQVAFDVTCVLPPPGTIAFLSERGNNSQREVFLMDGAGGNIRQITDMSSEGEKNSALLSPNGAKVLFDTWNGRDLWVVNSDGTGLLNLTDSPYTEDGLNAAWSPDGSKIVFSRTGDSQECAVAPEACGWWTINSDGSGLARLLPDSGDGFQGGLPDWSPDGSQIAFTGWVPGNYTPGVPYFDLFVVNSDGSGLVQLTEGENGEDFPDWSPDGSRIAFTECCSGNFRHLLVMAPDGTNLQQLTGDGLGWDAGAPAWSPDGSKILFGCTGMCLINPDGSGLVNFTQLYAGATAWAPDGSAIGFSSNPGSRDDVFTIRPDGTGLSNLTNMQSRDFFGSWGP